MGKEIYIYTNKKRLEMINKANVTNSLTCKPPRQRNKFSTQLSIIVLEINGLNSPFKRFCFGSQIFLIYGLKKINVNCLLSSHFQRNTWTEFWLILLPKRATEKLTNQIPAPDMKRSLLSPLVRLVQKTSKRSHPTDIAPVAPH